MIATEAWSPAPPIGDVLARAAATLRSAGCTAPGLDAVVLLAALLRVPASALDDEAIGGVADAQLDRYGAWIHRRAQGEPVAYITGRQPFLGLELLADRRALVVRPMTSIVTQLALELARSQGRTGLLAADIGTGGGAVAIALAVLEPSFSRVYATDIDAGALGLAQANVRRYGQDERIRLLLGDLFQPVPEAVDLVVANLPYVPVAERAVLDTGFEPARAFDGGADGLDLVRRFAAQLPGHLRPGGGLVLEVGPSQRRVVESLLQAHVPGLRFASTSGASWAPHVVVGFHQAAFDRADAPGFEKE